LKAKVHHLDLRGTISPITLLKVSQVFREMGTGQILEVLASDPDTKEEIFRVLNPSQYELIETKEQDSFYQITLKKE